MSNILASSFRDPSGFLFRDNGLLYRQVNKSYQECFNLLESSGFFRDLFDKNWLIYHEKVSHACVTPEGVQVIKPVEIPVITYPYEWSFSQLKEAALLTLDIQLQAIEHGFSLKDASAYNVQFYQGRSVFIDSLSFESLPEGKPWVAYKQFCQHFLAPLALMAKTDISLQQLLITNIDGIPLNLTSNLLPLSTKLNFSLLVHIHLHAKSQAKHANRNIGSQRDFSKHAFRALIDNLKTTIQKLEWIPEGTEWNDYYQSNNNYEKNSLELKEGIVEKYIRKVEPDSVWDLGANNGRFSQIASKHSGYVCAWDIDPACVENNYRSLKKSKSNNIYPLLLDLASPSPSIGWANDERDSLVNRGPVDVVMALGLIHHLVIGNNLPLRKVAAFLSDISNNIIIEFVPKQDSQVVKLLRNREDIFNDYDQKSFEEIFLNVFEICESEKIDDSERTIYLMKNRGR